MVHCLSFQSNNLIVFSNIQLNSFGIWQWHMQIQFSLIMLENFQILEDIHFFTFVVSD